MYSGIADNHFARNLGIAKAVSHQLQHFQFTFSQFAFRLKKKQPGRAFAPVPGG
jgi:hypothetical protein